MIHPFPQKILVDTCSQNNSFENIVGKGEIDPKVFSTHFENFLPFSSNLKLLSATSFSLEESKICCLGKGQPFTAQYFHGLNTE